MKIKEKISFEEINGKTFKIREIEALDNGKAAFTHFLNNSKNRCPKSRRAT